MSAPARREAVQCEEVPETGECVLLHAAEGRVLALNPLGAALWELLDGQRDAEALAGIVSQATGAEPLLVEADVRALLAKLAAEGFLA
jgi:hypothetical protein